MLEFNSKFSCAFAHLFATVGALNFIHRYKISLTNKEGDKLRSAVVKSPTWSNYKARANVISYTNTK